jgi:hypothetical protein
MIGILLVTASLVSWPSLWLFGIRPYLSSRGRPQAICIYFLLSAWVDWNECLQLARSQGDRKAALLCRLFLILHLLLVIGVVAAVNGI